MALGLLSHKRRVVLSALGSHYCYYLHGPHQGHVDVKVHTDFVTGFVPITDIVCIRPAFGLKYSTYSALFCITDLHILRPCHVLHICIRDEKASRLSQSSVCSANRCDHSIPHSRCCRVPLWDTGGTKRDPTIKGA